MNAPEKNALEIARNYIACWNEIDIDRRRALLETHWQAQADYVDPLMAGANLLEIEALIAAVQARFPGHSFTLKEGTEGHNGRIRFSWSLDDNNAPQMPAIAHGTDFVTLGADGRIAHVTGFLDQVAA
ncbi:MAG: nuclear transport factor 2 family protein [Proteobacteria bacterium]|nr:nuclear transport factor 2 family protein [Pseudomonadota bacterium]